MSNDFLSTNCKYSVIVARMMWKVNGIIDGWKKLFHFCYFFGRFFRSKAQKFNRYHREA